MANRASWPRAINGQQIFQLEIAMKGESVNKVSCANCAKCEQQQLPPPNIGKALICRALPPTPMLMPGPNGQAGLVSVFPIVGADNWCYQFEEKSAEAAGSPILAS